MISVTDVGRCLAVLALAPPTDRICAVTGPEAIGLSELALRAAATWHAPIRYTGISCSAECCGCVD